MDPYWIIQDLQDDRVPEAQRRWFDRCSKRDTYPGAHQYQNPLVAERVAVEEFYGWGVARRVVQRTLGREDIVLSEWRKAETR